MKIRFLIALFFISLFIPAFSQKNNINSNDAVMKELDRLAQTLCDCIIQIGSTYSGKTQKEREELRTRVVPTLFIKFGQREMLTTGGFYGKKIKKQSMEQYFENLQKQSEKKFGQVRKYDIYPEFMTNQNGIEWHVDTLARQRDGSIQQYAILTIVQTYELSSSSKGDMHYKKRIEKDVKEIKVLRLLDNGTITYGLGDVTRVERHQTYNH